MSSCINCAFSYPQKSTAYICMPWLVFNVRGECGPFITVVLKVYLLALYSLFHTQDYVWKRLYFIVNAAFLY